MCKYASAVYTKFTAISLVDIETEITVRKDKCYEYSYAIDKTRGVIPYEPDPITSTRI